MCARATRPNQWRVSFGTQLEKECAMSTDYRLIAEVSACEVFDGRLEEFGVREHIMPDTTTEGKRLLTDGRNYLWVSIDDGVVSYLTRYASTGAPGKILNALTAAFDTDIVSECEPQFWGFDTQDEWDAWQEKIYQENQRGFISKL
jgi:hypothetical protein